MEPVRLQHEDVSTLQPSTRMLARVCLLGPGCFIAVLSLLFLAVNFFIGLIWMYVWLPYVLASTLLGIAALVVTNAARQRDSARPFVAMLIAWITAWPVGAGLAVLGSYFVELINQQSGTISYTPRLTLSGYYWWASAPLIVLYVGVTLACLAWIAHNRNHDSVASSSQSNGQAVPTPP